MRSSDDDDGAIVDGGLSSSIGRIQVDILPFVDDADSLKMRLEDAKGAIADQRLSRKASRRILRFMPTGKPNRPAVSLAKLRPALKPVMDPVIERLDRNENLLLEMKAALDVQFRRTAEIQAQLDMLIARLEKERK